MKTAKIMLVACMLVAVPLNAYAYLDPGTGSYLLQIAIGGIVSAAFAVKMFWKSIKYKLSNLFKKDK